MVTHGKRCDRLECFACRWRGIFDGFGDADRNNDGEITFYDTDQNDSGTWNNAVEDAALASRGIGKLEEPNVMPGSYADYDRALLITAKGIEEQTEFDVVLDTSPQLFQPGACPDAALYCGWYSLAKYVDAFEWKPGAVDGRPLLRLAGSMKFP